MKMAQRDWRAVYSGFITCYLVAVYLITLVLFIHLDCFGVSFGDISCSVVVCFLSNKMELVGSLLDVLRVPKKHLKNSTAVSLSRNHNPVNQDNPQILLWVCQSESATSADISIFHILVG